MRKQRASSRRGGTAKRVEKTATQKSAVNSYQRFSSSFYEGLRLKNRAQRESSKRRPTYKMENRRRRGERRELPVKRFHIWLLVESSRWNIRKQKHKQLQRWCLDFLNSACSLERRFLLKEDLVSVVV